MATNEQVGTKLHNMKVERLVADYRACERLSDDLATDPHTINDPIASHNLRMLENRMDVLESELNRRGLNYDGKPITTGEQFFTSNGRQYWRCIIHVPGCRKGPIAWFIYDCTTHAVSGDISRTLSLALSSIENWIEGQQS